mgnify:CR=1 FL=1
MRAWLWALVLAPGLAPGAIPGLTWHCEEEVMVVISELRRPGGDLLSHALRRSTIGAEGFHGRVRDGIGCGTLAMTTRPAKTRSMLTSP